MINFNFYTIKEKVPTPKQSGVFLIFYNYDVPYYKIIEDRVELAWEELDKYGYPTGNLIEYSKDIKSLKNYKLFICLETSGDVLNENTYWCPDEEFNSKFPILKSFVSHTLEENA